MKKVARILLSLLILTLILSTLTTVSAAGKTTVHFWHAMGGQLGETVQTLVDEFNKSQDKYYVEAMYKGNYSETMTAAVAAYRSKNNPHIVQVFEVGTQTMLLTGAVYPVYQLMEDAGIKMNWERFVQPVLSYYTKDGNLYSMPFNSSTPILYYNKDALKKAGLDPEKPPVTWQELEKYSLAMIKAGAIEYGFSVGWPSWTMIENMRAWHGLPMATKENGFAGLDTELLINDEFGQMHLGKMVEWQKKKIFRYGGRRGDADPMFANGQVAFYIQSSATIGGFSKTITKFQWATSQLPHWGKPYEKVNSIIGGATLWVLKGRKNAEYKGVAQFLHFLSQPRQQAFWHKSTGYVAISKDAQESLDEEGYLAQNPNQRTAYSQLTYSIPKPDTRGIRLGNFVQIRDIIEEEMENIFNGKKSVKQGLDDAAGRSNRLLRDFERIYK